MSVTVAKNAFWNVSAQVASLAVGMAALPLLLHQLGAARLGIFTLALGLIGFSGLFDLGLGRALTQTVSSSLAQGRSRAEVAALVWKVVAMLAALGFAWLAAFWLAVPDLVERLFSLTGKMARETTFGLRALAISIPFVLTATGAMGALEGLQQFRLLSLWRMPMSLMQFGLPVIAALIRSDIGWAIAALAATRLLWMALWLTHLSRLLPRASGVTAKRSDLHHALHFGGWLSVSNLIGPLMIYADRFYLASLFPPAMVAYYTVPFDTAFRATSLSQTAMNALFPALAETQARPESAVWLLDLALRAVLVLVLPVVLMVAVFAHPLLVLWLNESFAVSAAPVLRSLLVGILLNSAAHLPYALLQAHGRADLTAKLHIAELPLFAAMLVAGTHCFGITGAAWAWTLRVALDTSLLYFTAWRLQPALRVVLAKGAGWLVLSTVVFLLAAYAFDNLLQRVFTAIIVVACACALLRLLWMSTRREITL